MSIESLGSPLATGHTAEIYHWKAGYILKLFRQGRPLKAIEHEAQVSRLVCQAGLSTPAVEEVIEINGRYGLVYERICGHPMLHTLATRPWAFSQYAHTLAELQAELHRVDALPGLPAQHLQLRKKIQAADILPLEIRRTVLNMLDNLPEGKQLCHGDFHPDNVLITKKGPVIIDWVDATNGNPLGDIARSSLLMTKSPIPVHRSIQWLVTVGRQQFYRMYLKRYFQLCPREQEFAAWQIVNAAGRLSEGIPEAQALVTFVHTQLIKASSAHRQG